jgi:chemosensory pili system protein ChpA (sensor histidine kinase/response regulator)
LTALASELKGSVAASSLRMRDMKRTEDFDSEPLGWVKADIDRALNRAGTALRDFHSDGDAGHLLQAREELHRVHGALNMLGKLDGLARLAARCEEILATPAPPPGKELLALLATGLEAIGGYLDDLLAGQPNRALRLWPVYRELGRADGRNAPVDLTLTLPSCPRSAATKHRYRRRQNVQLD